MQGMDRTIHVSFEFGFFWTGRDWNDGLTSRYTFGKVDVSILCESNISKFSNGLSKMEGLRRGGSIFVPVPGSRK